MWLDTYFSGKDLVWRHPWPSDIIADIISSTDMDVWIINTEAVTVAFPERKLQELRDLLNIPISQRHTSHKDLERLVGKLRSMHLTVPGAVAHLYHIQCALSQAGMDRACLSPVFHRKIAEWKVLADQTADRPTHIAVIFCR